MEKLFKIYLLLFIYFYFGCSGSSVPATPVATLGLSVVAASRAYFYCGVHASHHGGLPFCRAQALELQDSVVAVFRLWIGPQ